LSSDRPFFAIGLLKLVHLLDLKPPARRIQTASVAAANVSLSKSGGSTIATYFVTFTFIPFEILAGRENAHRAEHRSASRTAFIRNFMAVGYLRRSRTITTIRITKPKPPPPIQT